MKFFRTQICLVGHLGNHPFSPLYAVRISVHTEHWMHMHTLYFWRFPLLCNVIWRQSNRPSEFKKKSVLMNPGELKTYLHTEFFIVNLTLLQWRVYHWQLQMLTCTQIWGWDTENNPMYALQMSNDEMNEQNKYDYGFVLTMDAKLYNQVLFQSIEIRANNRVVSMFCVSLNIVMLTRLKISRALTIFHSK